MHSGVRIIPEEFVLDDRFGDAPMTVDTHTAVAVLLFVALTALSLISGIAYGAYRLVRVFSGGSS